MVIVIVLLTVSCIPSRIDRASSTPSTSYPPLVDVWADAPKYGPADLDPSSFSNAGVKAAGNDVLMLSTPPLDIDVVEWRACTTPKACVTGSSSRAHTLVATLPVGRYQVQVRTCVRPERSKSGAAQCGPWGRAISYEQGAISNPFVFARMEQDEQLDREFAQLGERVHQLASAFETSAQRCREVDPQMILEARSLRFAGVDSLASGLRRGRLGDGSSEGLELANDEDNKPLRNLPAIDAEIRSLRNERADLPKQLIGHLHIMESKEGLDRVTQRGRNNRLNALKQEVEDLRDNWDVKYKSNAETREYKFGKLRKDLAQIVGELEASRSSKREAKGFQGSLAIEKLETYFKLLLNYDKNMVRLEKEREVALKKEQPSPPTPDSQKKVVKSPEVSPHVRVVADRDPLEIYLQEALDAKELERLEAEVVAELIAKEAEQREAATSADATYREVVTSSVDSPVIHHDPHGQLKKYPPPNPLQRSHSRPSSSPAPTLKPSVRSGPKPVVPVKPGISPPSRASVGGQKPSKGRNKARAVGFGLGVAGIGAAAVIFAILKSRSGDAELDLAEPVADPALHRAGSCFGDLVVRFRQDIESIIAEAQRLQPIDRANHLLLLKELAPQVFAK